MSFLCYTYVEQAVVAEFINFAMFKCRKTFHLKDTEPNNESRGGGGGRQRKIIPDKYSTLILV